MSDDTDVEAKAAELGWIPKDQFKGDPERWVDAETFVRRGEELMPLLKATNRRQKEQIERLAGEVAETKAALAAATDAIEALTETTSKAAIAEVKRTRTALRDQLKEARESEDLDKELEIQDKIREVDQALEKAETPPKKVKKEEAPAEGQDYTKAPEFKAWKEKNPWFGTDHRKTALALGLANALRAEGDTSTGAPFFERVTEELEKLLDTGRRDAPSKVEGDSRPTRSAGGKGKTYSDLPQEARDACERQAQRVVGKNRAFADIESWRKHYTNAYFQE